MRLSHFFVLCLFLAAPAFAANDSVRHVSAASERYAPSSEHAYGLGVADTSNVTNGESISGLMSMGHDWVQGLVAVYTTKGNFDFAVGGIYKFTVVGTRSTGFHMGPGFTIGSVGGDFAWAFFGAAGGHFTVAEHLMLSVDAGPMVTHTKNNTNFRLRALGDSVLSLAVHYLF